MHEDFCTVFKYSCLKFSIEPSAGGLLVPTQISVTSPPPIKKKKK